MKIDVNSIRPVNQYKITSQNVAAIKTDPVQKTDKVEISGDAKMFSDALIEAKKSIQERMDKPASDFSNIKEKVDRDEYGVESRDLADDILLDK